MVVLKFRKNPQTKLITYRIYMVYLSLAVVVLAVGVGAEGAVDCCVRAMVYLVCFGLFGLSSLLLFRAWVPYTQFNEDF